MTTDPTGGVHTEAEDHGWIIDIGDHPEHADSPGYVASRAAMIKIVQATQPWFFGGPPYDFTLFVPDTNGAEAATEGRQLVLAPDHPLARAAFNNQ